MITTVRTNQWGPYSIVCELSIDKVSTAVKVDRNKLLSEGEYNIYLVGE